MNLYYRTFGAGDPLYILHGLFGSSDNWFTLGKSFAEKFEVVIVDMRNHGQSPHSHTWTYEAMAEDIKKLADNLGHTKINVVGHSMGGKIGMKMANQYPDLISKLAVVDIAPKLYPVHHRTIMDGLLSIDLDRLSTRKDADLVLSNYIPDNMVRQFLLKNLYRESDGSFRWKLNLTTINEHLQNVGEDTYPSHEISIPTQFIRGINSNYISDDDIMDIRQYFSNSSVETIGNAGHWVHAEQPEALFKTVMGFLK